MEYANSLKGVAIFAMTHWKFYCAEFEKATNECDAMLATGRAGAYAAIIRQITGRQPHDPIAQEIIDLM